MSWCCIGGTGNTRSASGGPGVAHSVFQSGLLHEWRSVGTPAPRTRLREPGGDGGCVAGEVAGSDCGDGGCVAGGFPVNG